MWTMRRIPSILELHTKVVVVAVKIWAAQPHMTPMLQTVKVVIHVQYWLLQKHRVTFQSRLVNIERLEIRIHTLLIAMKTAGYYPVTFSRQILGTKLFVNLSVLSG